MSDELLPCPFCGGEAKVDGPENHVAPGIGIGYSIFCDNDDCYLGCMDSPIFYHWRPDAVTAWNARAAVTDEQFAQAVHDGRAWEPARTCRDFGGEEGTNGEGYDFACSACGWCGDVTEPNYCQNCGAKVVGECER